MLGSDSGDLPASRGGVPRLQPCALTPTPRVRLWWCGSLGQSAVPAGPTGLACFPPVRVAAAQRATQEPTALCLPARPALGRFSGEAILHLRAVVRPPG